MNDTDHELHLAAYDFERRFNDRVAIEWMQENWSKSFVFCGLYTAAIFGGQHFMRERQKLDLRKPLVLWSLGLAIFSIIGTLRTGWYMLHVLNTSGFKQSVCDQGYHSGPVCGFWTYAFVLSKALELGDTVFIVLRKKRLIFLQWYHHSTVLIYCWYSYKDRGAGGGWGISMNYLAHSLKYIYLALRAVGVRFPRPYALMYTACYIAEMVMGLTLIGLVYLWMEEGHCPSSLENIMWTCLLYLSYLFLLSSSFYQAYLKDPQAKGPKRE